MYTSRWADVEQTIGKRLFICYIHLYSTGCYQVWRMPANDNVPTLDFIECNKQFGAAIFLRQSDGVHCTATKQAFARKRTYLPIRMATPT